MADITMCKGIECPIKKDCYRFTAIPNKYRQSAFLNSPYDKDKKECKRKIENNER
jgi:hypothetical protein